MARSGDRAITELAIHKHLLSPYSAPRQGSGKKKPEGSPRRLWWGGLIAGFLAEEEVHEVSGANEARAGEEFAGSEAGRGAHLDGEGLDALFDLLFGLRAELGLVAGDRFQ